MGTNSNDRPIGGLLKYLRHKQPPVAHLERRVRVLVLFIRPHVAKVVQQVGQSPTRASVQQVSSSVGMALD